MNFSGEMPAIHVVIANLPHVVEAAISQTLVKQRNIIVESSVHGEIALLLAVKPSTDVLLLGTPSLSPPPGICSHLLNEFPHLRILAIEAETDMWAVYWLGVKQKTFAKLLIETLLKDLYQAYYLDLDS